MVHSEVRLSELVEVLFVHEPKKAILQKLFKNYIQVPIIPETGK